MIRFEAVETYGWGAAVRGMRNPKNSWSKSDSVFSFLDGHPHLGPNDMKLMKTLREAGTDHRKFLRMIVVSMDITAPLYWWKEYDTYKVGTVANSCSTMHKIAAKPFEIADFSCEHLVDSSLCCLEETIEKLNFWRIKFIIQSNPETVEKGATSAKNCWWQMIQLLPTSYNQLRTVILNYEVLANIYKSRRNHKLDEWHAFCDWIETLPYSWLITGKEACGDE